MATNELPRGDESMRPVAAIQGPGETVYVVLEDGEMLQYVPGNDEWRSCAPVPYTQQWYKEAGAPPRPRRP